MGNKSSTPLSALFPPAAASAPAPAPALIVPQLNSAQQCAVRKVELHQIDADLQRKQNDVDTCDPQAAQARKTASAIKENQNFVDKNRKELAQATTEYNRQVKIAKQISEATEPLDEYMATLKQELAHLNKENEQLERKERANRRRFLDNDPQAGVGGAPGVRTQDDKVMLAFWICYGAALIAGMILITKMFEAQIGGTKEKILVSLGVIGAAYGLAYSIIVFYA